MLRDYKKLDADASVRMLSSTSINTNKRVIECSTDLVYQSEYPNQWP